MARQKSFDEPLPKSFRQSTDEPSSKPRKESKVAWRMYPQSLHFDGRFQALSRQKPSARTLYIHLITGPHTCQIPGIAFIGRAAMAEELGWELDDFDRSFAEVEAQGLVIADWTNRVIYMPEVHKYDRPQNPNIIIGWKEAWSRIPACEPKLMAWLDYEKSLSGRNDFLDALRNSCPKPLSNDFANHSDKGFRNRSANHKGNAYPKLQGSGISDQGSGNKDHFKSPSQEQEISQVGVGTTSHAGAHTRLLAGTDDRGRLDDWEALRPLRAHQVSAIALLRRALGQGKQAPMLAAPCGAGKTRIAAEIVAGALAKDKRVLIIVPALSLVDQTVAALEAEGIVDIGVIQGIHERTDSAAPVQVATVQTLQKRKMPLCDVILIDEAHRWFKFFAKMIADAKTRGVPVIGLSATPWTKGLGKHFDDLLPVANTRGLIDAGYLSKFRVFAPSHPDLTGVRTVAGDYHEGQLAEAMNKPDLVADVVATWLRRGEGRPTMCFGVDRAHAKGLQKQFIEAGIPTGYIDANTSSEERAKVRHQFHTGEIQVCCNVGCLTTGVDWDVRCIILARPTKSEILFVQIIGRGLRIAPGKTDALILDHSDTHLRLGFVTDIHHDHLDDGRERATTVKTKPLAKPIECTKCKFVRPAKVPACPDCGFKPERQSTVEVEDGQLVELGAKKAKESKEFRTSVYGQLKYLAKERGKKEGWAAHMFREYFGGWPNDVSWAPQQEPDIAIRGWVRSRQIAYAKRKGQPDAHPS